METYANWMPSIFPLSADDDYGKEVTFPHELKEELNEAIMKLQNIEQVQSSDDVKSIKEIIIHLWNKGALPSYATAQKICNLDKDIIPWNLIAEQQYADVLQAISRLFSTEWPKCFDNEERCILNVFKIDHHFDFVHESWTCLLDRLPEIPDTVVEIFKFLLEDENLIFVTYLQVCKEYASLLEEFKETIQSVPEQKIEQFNVKTKHFLQILISLPTRCANYLHGNVKDIFLTSNYCQLLLQHFIKALWFLMHCEHHVAGEPTYFDTKFLADMLTRLIKEFCKDIERGSVLSLFLEIIEKFCYYDMGRNIIHKLFAQIDDSIAIQRLILCMLKSDLDIYQIIGSCGKDCIPWEFCFMQKLSIQRIPDSNTCITGMVQYVAKLDDNLMMLRNLFENVLNIWSKRTTLHKLSQTEHFNLTKLLMLCGKCYCTCAQADEDQEIKRLLHEGLRHHLECPNNEQRYIGMKCVETIFNLMSNLDIKEDEKLKFDYSAIEATHKGKTLQEMDELLNVRFSTRHKNKTLKGTEELEKLLNDFMTNATKNNISSAVVEDSRNTSSPSRLETQDLCMSPPPAKSPRMELDSDDDDEDDTDDLPPYDMSNDIPQLMEKRPKFLFDLLKTLSTKCENYEVFESALASAEQLIRSQLPRSDARLSLDLMQVFLPLDMQFYFENFDETKFKCCVAICSSHPAECAEYVCRQFHTDNSFYSVDLRILMLQILSATAKELSGITGNEKQNMDTPIPSALKNVYVRKFNFENEQANRLAANQRIIKSRLKEKTKIYFSKTRKNSSDSSKKPTANRFHSVVGVFFFSLIRGDRTKQMLYVKYDRLAHDIDTMLMVNFLHTLSVIVLAAQNCPLLPAMTREIFDICSFVRFSPESRIRLTCLELLGITLVTTPGYILVDQFSDRLLDLKYWLEDFIKSPLVGGETSEECREIATQILNTCYKIMNPRDDDN